MKLQGLLWLQEVAIMGGCLEEEISTFESLEHCANGVVLEPKVVLIEIQTLIS